MVKGKVKGSPTVVKVDQLAKAKIAQVVKEAVILRLAKGKVE